MPELEDSLSERELDVLRCVAQGASNREIALELSISHNTVKVHLRNIFAKLGVSSRTEATTVALQMGLVSIPGMELTGDKEAADGEYASLEEDALLEGGDLLEEDALFEDGALAVNDAPPEPFNKGALPETAVPPRHLHWGWAALAALLIITLLLATASRFWPQATPVIETADTPTPATVAAIAGSNWLDHGPLPQPLTGMASAVVGLNIYLIGGETAEGQVVNNVAIYQTDARQWQTAASKPTAVTDATAAVLFGELYVVGGRGADGSLTAVVEAYSPANNAWRRVASLPRPISGGLTLSNGGFLFLFGGWDGRDYLAESYIYDPGADSWRPLPPMGAPRAWAAGEYVAGQFYVVGGFDGRDDLAICEAFDPTENQWRRCPDMLQPRAAASAATLFNRLYVIGGGLDSEVDYSELFDPSQQLWLVINTPMLLAEPTWTGLTVATVERDIFAVGGRQNDQLQPNAFVYVPFPYQINIPAASSGRD